MKDTLKAVPTKSEGIGYIKFDRKKGTRIHTVGAEAIEFLEWYEKNNRLQFTMLPFQQSNFLLAYKNQGVWRFTQAFQTLADAITYLSPSRLRVLIEYTS
jgi:hypothetical protein